MFHPAAPDTSFQTRAQSSEEFVPTLPTTTNIQHLLEPTSYERTSSTSSSTSSTTTSSSSSASTTSLSSISSTSSTSSTMSTTMMSTTPPGSTHNWSNLTPRQRWRAAKDTVSNVLFLHKRYPWFQLAGHSDQFVQHHSPNWILKAVSSNEKAVFLALKDDDTMKPFTPEFKGLVTHEGKEFIQLQNCLFGYKEPSAIDCKMGRRTYLEADVSSRAPRLDLLKKLDKLDPEAASEEERRIGVTKLRYMEHREVKSTTSSLGFRIEALKMGTDEAKSFKVGSMTELECVVEELRKYIFGSRDIRDKFVKRLTELREALTKSDFFRRHECVGSSLLMLHDTTKVGVWMIDFGKTVPVDRDLDHLHFSEDHLGNHEDGYLRGLDMLIVAMKQV
eukprot:m.262613 g.262613  ORF g.262613 m.262613 type:complete len:390 (-) comp46401_c0_seq1:172-1341(-)